MVRVKPEIWHYYLSPLPFPLYPFPLRFPLYAFYAFYLRCL